MRPHSVEVLINSDALSEHVAAVFAQAVDEAVSDKGTCSFALSRPTPEPVFRAVNRQRIPRRVSHMYQVDERAADSGTDDRNLTLIERYLDEWVKSAELHPMKIDTESPESGERKYAKELEAELGSPPVFDFIHLGLGPDGHTASLVAGDPVLDVTDKWVTTTKKADGFKRLTLTYPVINAARLILFVVSGREKAEALRAVLTGDMSKPAARIEASNVRFYVDSEAASLL